MKINDFGIHFEKYVTGCPDYTFSSFTDSDGARLVINSKTLIKMYELLKFDLERRGLWEQRLETMGD